MALCSEYIFHHEVTQICCHNEMKAWVRILLENGVKRTLVNDLEHLEISDFSDSYKRVGVFVHQNSPNKIFVRRFRKFPSIPLWVCYGSSPQHAHIPEFEEHGLNFRPTAQEVADARAKRLITSSTTISEPRRSPSTRSLAPVPGSSSGWGTTSSSSRTTSSAWETTSSDQNTWETTSLDEEFWNPSTSSHNIWTTPSTSTETPLFTELPVSAESSHARPRPGRITRQFPGETWQEFEDRQKQRYAEKLAVESEDARRSRIDRERAQERHQCPGHTGPHVFHWDKNEDTGIRVRTAITRAQVPEYWENYTNSQRVYNSVDNEWDICSEFAPEASPPESGNWDDDDEVYPPRPPSPDAPPAYPVSPPPPAPETWLDLPQPPPQPRVPSFKTLTCSADFKELLFQRYGFLCTTEPAAYPASQHASPKLALFGHGDNNLAISPRERSHIRHFASSFTPSNPVPTFTTDIWDLSPDTLFPIHLHANNRFYIVPVDNPSGFYVLEIHEPSRSDPCWALALRDATTALECLRRNDESVEKVVSFLVSTGRPFTTLIRAPKYLRPPPPPPPLFTLGWRPTTLKIQPDEYLYYEDLRNQFFLQPQSRAAFLRGGITWRLAMESTDNFSLERVLNGPSNDAFNYPGSRLGAHIWYDDKLSEGELDLISGVYKVSSGTVFDHLRSACVTNFAFRYA